MCKQLLFACLAVALLRAPEQLYAQFTDPNNYDNAPVGLNQLEFDYYYAHSDASIDPSLIVAGATFNLNHGIIDYTHYFGFIHRLAWVEATLPLADLSGSINGTTNPTWLICAVCLGSGNSGRGFPDTRRRPPRNVRNIADVTLVIFFQPHSISPHHSLLDLTSVRLDSSFWGISWGRAHPIIRRCSFIRAACHKANPHLRSPVTLSYRPSY